MPLYDILNEFQKGHSHMAAVVRYSEEKLYMINKNKEINVQHKRHVERAVQGVIVCLGPWILIFLSSINLIFEICLIA